MALDRRHFLSACATMGVGSTLLPGVLWARLDAGAEITKETIACAEEIAGVHFTDEQRAQMVDNLKRQAANSAALHKILPPNSVQPAIVFDPVPPGKTLPERITVPAKPAATHSRVPLMARPQGLEELAFQPVTVLSDLVHRRKVKSIELTEMYLGRLKRFDPTLHAVITLTEDRARRQARAMDEELARGKSRGPLHGIPWGAKDLLAAKGYKTTWGAGPYKDQVIDADATVVQRLDRAGAVLVAKLTLGELAQGDIWFGGTTRNPWWPEQGSSGSSAGPGSTVSAGLVGFAIGTETLGSISSPSTRNGVTGLRPTFGRVPRTGAMALSWTMDKIGPMCRAVEDCALVLAAIYGPDGFDKTVKPVPFVWDPSRKATSLRVGYFKSAFDAPERDEKTGRVMRPTKAADDAALATLRKIGIELIPVDVPDVNTSAMGMILTSEAGAAFEELTLSGHVNEMVQQGPFAWPNTFRSAQFISAVDYVNANRVRTQASEAWWELFRKVDVVVTPTNATNQLTATNLTGNPAVILPHGFVESAPLPRAQGAAPADTTQANKPRPQVPVSLTFLGGLYDESRLLTVAKAFQDATDFHGRRPPGF